MESRAVIDLVALAESLPSDLDDLRGAARVWFSRHSCDADLGVADAYLRDAVRFNSTKRDSLQQAKGALLQSAVIHYARAFDPASKHRSHISISKHLDDKGKELHSLLIELRHESLAHFGPAGEGGSSWSEDIPAVIIENGRWQPMIASKRSLYRAGLVTEMLAHLEKIQPIVSRLSEKSKNHFTTLFQKYWEENPDFENLLSKCQMDPTRIGGWEGPFLSGSRSGRQLQTLSDSLFGNKP